MNLIKNYKNKLGSHDYEIKDGQELEIIFIYGFMDGGSPNFRKNHYKRVEQTIQLGSIEEAMMLQQPQ